MTRIDAGNKLNAMTTERAGAITPRGTDVMLPHGGLPEVIPQYLQKLIIATGGAKGPLGLQFVAQPELEALHANDGLQDSLIEDINEVPGAPGLVYKYQDRQDGDMNHPGRALWTITRTCAAYCRFCTRGREVGIPSFMEGQGTGTLAHTPHLSDAQIEQTLAFIKEKPGLNEIILSGGDPLTIRPDKLKYVLGRLRELQDSGKLDIVRIGTRVPIHNPVAVKEAHYEAISQLRNPFMMIHINHPAELTPEALHVLNRFRKDCGAIVMSQTVLLKGVNDSVETLAELFRKMAREGIRPYYVFQNDPVYWAQHLTVPIKDAINIWGQLRPRLSGVAATARFVIDTPEGYGKVAIPEGDSWHIDFDSGYDDFKNGHFNLK